MAEAVTARWRGAGWRHDLHPCLPAPHLAHPSPADGLARFLAHPLTAAILALPEDQLAAYLVNDAYKPRMHK